MTPEHQHGQQARHGLDVGTISLEELRSYRQRLRDEDDRVSYWRRLVHGRIDLLRAGTEAPGALTLHQVVRALGDTGTGVRREALHRVRAHDQLPDLPVLAEVWHDDAPLAGLERAAEQLSAYRTALHRRLDAATDELIDRYREDPALALGVLTR